MTNPLTFGFFNGGILDGYWGVGTANYRYALAGEASLLFPPQLIGSGGFGNFAFTDAYDITTRNFLQFINQLALPNPVYYVEDTGIVGSNRTVQVVVLLNTNNTPFLSG